MVNSWFAQVGTTHLFASSSSVIESVFASKKVMLGFAVSSTIIVASSAYSPKLKVLFSVGMITKFLILIKV